jgi:hypothetical protein
LIVSSPDEGHWGESEFAKRRDDVCGRFMYFPIWELEELQMARTHLSNFTRVQLSAKDVVSRFRQAGGVPRHLFSSKTEFAQALDTQTRALAGLSKDQAQLIAKKKMDAVGRFSNNQPRSVLLGYRFAGDSFSKCKIDVISSEVEEKILRICGV